MDEEKTLEARGWAKPLYPTMEERGWKKVRYRSTDPNWSPDNPGLYENGDWCWSPNPDFQKEDDPPVAT